MIYSQLDDIPLPFTCGQWRLLSKSAVLGDARMARYCADCVERMTFHSWLEGLETYLIGIYLSATEIEGQCEGDGFFDVRTDMNDMTVRIGVNKLTAAVALFNAATIRRKLASREPDENGFLHIAQPDEEDIGQRFRFFSKPTEDSFSVKPRYLTIGDNEMVTIRANLEECVFEHLEELYRKPLPANAIIAGT